MNTNNYRQFLAKIWHSAKQSVMRQGVAVFALFLLSCNFTNAALAEPIHINELTYNTSFSDTKISVIVKDVNVTNSSLEEQDLRKLLTFNDVKTLSTQFQKFSAQAFTIGSIKITVELSKTNLVYDLKNVNISSIHEGILDDLTIASTNFDADTKSNPDQSVHGSAQLSVLKTFNLPNYLSLLNARSDDNAPLLPIYELATINSLTFQDSKNNINVKIDSYEITKSVARQFSIALADLPSIIKTVTTDDKPQLSASAQPLQPSPQNQTTPDKLATQSQTLDAAKQAVTKQTPPSASPPSPAPPVASVQNNQSPQTSDNKEAQKKILVALLQDFFFGMEIGSEKINGITASYHKAPNSNDNFDLTLANATLIDFSKGQVGSLSINNLLMSNADNKFSLGSIALSNVDYSGFVRNLQSILDEKNHADDAALIRRILPHLGGLDIDAFNLETLVNPNMIDEGWPDNKIKISLDHFGLHNNHYLNDIPTNIILQIDHYTMDLPKNNPDYAMLQSLDYEKIDVNGKLALTWNEADQTLKLHTLSFDGKDMGGVNLSADVSHASADLFSPSQPVVEAAGLALVLSRAEITIINNSLFDRILTYEAKNKNIMAETLRKDLILGVSLSLPSILGSSPKSKLLIEAITKFIAMPKTLHVIAEAKNGLGMSDFVSIASPSELLEKMDIQANANQ